MGAGSIGKILKPELSDFIFYAIVAARLGCRFSSSDGRL